MSEKSFKVRNVSISVADTVGDALINFANSLENQAKVSITARNQFLIGVSAKLRYSKPKMLKKRKDLNKYKLKSVNKDKHGENPSEATGILYKPTHGKVGSIVPNNVVSKVNRGDRLTVKRGLFQKSQKSKLACRDISHQTENFARLNEDLNAIIPSANESFAQDVSPSLSYLQYDEPNNNIPPPASPDLQVTWETQPDLPSDNEHKTLPSNNYAHGSTNHKRAYSGRGSASSNRKRAYSSPESPSANRKRARSAHDSDPDNENRGSTRLSRGMLTRSMTREDHASSSRSPDDSYPRTRAYVNKQRELLSKYGAKAFELSSESSFDCSSPAPKRPSKTHLMSKYMELISFVEKRFVRVKEEVFKDSPCGDYLKALKKDLWITYKTPKQFNPASNDSNAPPDRDHQDPEPHREFVFSPNLPSVVNSPQSVHTYHREENISPLPHVMSQLSSNSPHSAYVHKEEFSDYAHRESSSSKLAHSSYAAHKQYSSNMSQCTSELSSTSPHSAYVHKEEFSSKLPHSSYGHREDCLSNLPRCCYEHRDNFSSHAHRGHLPSNSPQCTCGEHRGDMLSNQHECNKQLYSSYDDVRWRSNNSFTNHSSRQYNPGYYDNNNCSDNYSSYSNGRSQDRSPVLASYHSDFYSRRESKPQPSDYRACCNHSMNYERSPNSRRKGYQQTHEEYPRRMKRHSGLISVITLDSDEEEEDSPPMKFYPRKLF